MKYNLSSIYVLLILISIIICAKHTKEEWKYRTIYQLLTDRFAKSFESNETKCSDCNQYCGGTFVGIKKHLDYIKGMGFDAIWISPPLKNKEGSYHGYHNIDINSINEHFGTEQELKDLIQACHDKDIWVILDAVPNHMAGDVSIASLKPFNLDDHYHTLTDKDCEGHWDEQYYKENCRIYGMPDLNQENPVVNTTLINWLKNMLNKYDFDGVRYADVVNAPTWFWGNLTYAVDGTYTIGIFDSQDVDYIASYQNYMDGVGNYPFFRQVRNSFCEGSMVNLDNYIQTSRPKFKAPKYNGIWFDNHDNERFLYDCSLGTKFKGLRNIAIFTLFSEGIPIFYYGDEQYLDNGGENDRRRQPLFGNYDEESDLYIIIKIAHEVRKKYKIVDTDFVSRYVDEDNFVFTRGNDVMIAVSKGKTQTIEVRDHGFNDNDKFCNKLNTLDCVSVNNDVLIIPMNGEPKIYIRNSKGDLIYISSYLLFFLILLSIF